MAEVEWASIEDAPVKEKFGGAIRVRTLGARQTAPPRRSLKSIPVAAGKESMFMNLGRKKSM